MRFKINAYGIGKRWQIDAECDSREETEKLVAFMTTILPEQKNCDNCGYKVGYDNVLDQPNCNNCKIKSGCEYASVAGRHVRINCPDWKDNGVIRSDEYTTMAT